MRGCSLIEQVDQKDEVCIKRRQEYRVRRLEGKRERNCMELHRVMDEAKSVEKNRISERVK